jgi:aerobic carbon-monoxide dehydrogenase medium subunit
MKPAAFRYHAPKTVDEAVALLTEVAPEDGRVLAGGQSLVPIMAFRLARPSHLVDINGIDGLRTMAAKDGKLTIGACVRHAAFYRPVAEGPLGKLLATVVRHIAHHPIRTRGTFCGSIAHADPAAEMPGIAVTCDAEIAVVGKAGQRVIKAADFFQGALTTALTADEIITEIRLPPWPASRRWGFQEFARRRGDFAMAGAAVFYDTDASGKARNAHVGVIGVGDRPRRLPAVEAVLDGQVVDEATIAKAEAAACAAVDPQEDIHASAAYRRSLTGTMVERALKRAAT